MRKNIIALMLGIFCCAQSAQADTAAQTYFSVVIDSDGTTSTYDGDWTNDKPIIMSRKMSDWKCVRRAITLDKNKYTVGVQCYNRKTKTSLMTAAMCAAAEEDSNSGVFTMNVNLQSNFSALVQCKTVIVNKTST